jgi:hypothetical protein
MTAKRLLAVATCCVALSHVAQSEEPEAPGGPHTYIALVQEKVEPGCVNLRPKQKSNGGFGHDSAAASVSLSGPCPGRAAPQSDHAGADVIFDPAEMAVEVTSSGGGGALSDQDLGTTVTLRGPATATKVHVVEEFTVIGSIALSGSGTFALYTPCIIVSQGATQLGRAGCRPIFAKSAEVSETWPATVTVPATRGKAQFVVDESLNAEVGSSPTTPPAESASFSVTITPHQHIIEPGWTYTAAGHFKPRP